MPEKTVVFGPSRVCARSIAWLRGDAPSSVGPEECQRHANKRQGVEIEVSHVGPDLQFQSVEVNRTSAEERETA